MKARWLFLALACAALLPSTDAAAQRPFVVGVGHSGWLGFSYSADWDDEPDGIVVDTVMPESPAAQAGLRKGDTVLEVNGLRATPMLIGSLALEPGDVVELTVRREGSERSLQLIADERPEQFAFVGPQVFTLRTDSAFTMLRGMLDSARFRLDTLKFPRFYYQEMDDSAGHGIIIRRHGAGADTIRFGINPDSLRAKYRSFADSTRFHFGDADFDFEMEPLRGIVRVGFSAVAGMQLEELSPELGEYFGAERGLLVLEVGDETPAERAGIQEGDVILRVGDREVESIAGLRRVIARSDEDVVQIVVLRQRREVELELPVRR